MILVSGFAFFVFLDFILYLRFFRFAYSIHIFRCQYLAIFFEPGIDIGNMAFNFSFVEIVLFGVLSAQFGAVAGNKLTANQIKMFGQLHGCSENPAYRLWIVPPEIRDGIV